MIASNDTPNTDRSDFLYVWHDHVHVQRERAQLQFWSLSFVPDYNEKAIEEALSRVYERFGITSYITYQTLGQFDLLLRLWVPRNVQLEELNGAIEDRLHKEDLFKAEFLVVTNVDLHWVWLDREGYGPPREPTPDDVARVTNQQVIQLAEHNRDVLRVAKSHEAHPLPPPPTWVDDYLESNCLGKISVSEHGIRFYLTFNDPRKPFREEERRHALGAMMRQCEEVVRESLERFPQANPPQMSLYSGYGSMTQFLILARAPDQHFYWFMRRLVFALRESTIASLYRIRPYTTVMADRTFLDFREYPFVQNEPLADAVLAGPETSRLEFKATLLTSVRELVTGEEKLLEGVQSAAVRAVAGLLNSDEGGSLVIGLLELAREIERFRGDKGEYALRLADMFRLFPQGISIGDPDAKAVTGIEADYGLRKYSDPDSFRNYLRQLLQSEISPNPGPYYEIDFRPLEGRTLAVVNVNPRLATSFFYVGKQGLFFVRETTSTVSYAGGLGDDYRRVHPRSPT